MLAVTWFGRRGMLGPEPATGGLATGDATVPEIEVSRA
jgi:hypothetical protein